MENSTLQLLAKTIRGLAIDGVEAANSGHPGMPLGMADVAAVLWAKHLNHNPTNPHWINRDRFVLSAGHGSMLIYSLLHLFGYDLPLEELKNFRQWNSKTPGHPEYHHTPGIETTTGPLGQGISTAIGMAVAEAVLSDLNHYTYVIASDGDLQEGISHEACAFAGHQQLGKLIVLYDDNGISIDGETHLSFSEDVMKRFEAYGWHTQKIDGHHADQIDQAIQNAKSEINKPSIIACKTTIGFGSPNKAGSEESHGSPLGAEEARLTKENLGIPVSPSFFVPSEMLAFQKQQVEKGKKLEMEWREKSQWTETKVNFSEITFPEFAAGSSVATRNASGKVLDTIFSKIPGLIGGSADLTPSNKTFPKGETAFSPQNRQGRYIHYGIREHGMGAIMNGMALHGGIIPYGGTFFVFTDYMRASMRLAALMKLRVIYVMTHDSIGLGEDGPTHQPIEHLSSLRPMPNMVILRPMDAPETSESWKIALQRENGPTCLVLTRQNLPVYDRPALGMNPAELTSKGGYVLTEDQGFDRIIMASGSEVEIAVEAKKILNKNEFKVRVVSMPSCELFDQQSPEYKESVLPNSVRKRLAVEAGSTLSWHKYTGLDGKVVGLDHFGASAPFEKLYQEFGLTPENVAEKVKGL